MSCAGISSCPDRTFNSGVHTPPPHTRRQNTQLPFQRSTFVPTDHAPAIAFQKLRRLIKLVVGGLSAFPNFFPPFFTPLHVPPPGALQGFVQRAGICIVGAGNPLVLPPSTGGVSFFSRAMARDSTREVIWVAYELPPGPKLSRRRYWIPLFLFPMSVLNSRLPVPEEELIRRLLLAFDLPP